MSCMPMIAEAMFVPDVLWGLICFQRGWWLWRVQRYDSFWKNVSNIPSWTWKAVKIPSKIWPFDIKGNLSDGMMEVEKILPLNVSNQMKVVNTWFAEKFPYLPEEVGWKNCQLVAKVPSGKDQTLFEWDQHGWMLWTNKETGLDEAHLLDIFSEVYQSVGLLG